MSYSEAALTLGRVQVEFEALYGTKEMQARLTVSDLTKELTRICARENISFDSFQYLERALITNKQPKGANNEN